MALAELKGEPMIVAAGGALLAALCWRDAELSVAGWRGALGVTLGLGVIGYAVWLWWQLRHGD